jgi:hypothetical protein
LHTNGFRIPGRFEQRVDDPADDASASQFDRGGQADRTRAGDQDLGLCGHCVLLIMLRP